MKELVPPVPRAKGREQNLTVGLLRVLCQPVPRNRGIHGLAMHVINLSNAPLPAACYLQIPVAQTLPIPDDHAEKIEERVLVARYFLQEPLDVARSLVFEPNGHLGLERDALRMKCVRIGQIEYPGKGDGRIHQTCEPLTVGRHGFARLQNRLQLPCKDVNQHRDHLPPPSHNIRKPPKK